MRYRVEFESATTKSDFTEKCPDYAVPVVDTGTNFVLGIVVCVCSTRENAELVAAALNHLETVRQLVRSI